MISAKQFVNFSVIDCIKYKLKLKVYFELNEVGKKVALSVSFRIFSELEESYNHSCHEKYRWRC
jgi:hypothetical protein